MNEGKASERKLFIPNRKLYLSLLSGAILLTSISLLFRKNTSLFTILTSISCGGIASIIVAWLIDAANCKQNKQKAEYNRDAVFSELNILFESGVQFFIALCEKLGEEVDEKSEKAWDEWITLAFNLLGDDPRDLQMFCDGFRVFTDNIAEEASAIYLQAAQLLDSGMISQKEVDALAGLKSICSLGIYDARTLGDTKELAKRYVQNCNYIRHDLNGSILLSPINDKKVGSNLYRSIAECFNNSSANGPTQQ